MSNDINCGTIPEPKTGYKHPKPDKTVKKPFCIQASDEFDMFSFVACSKVDESKGDK